MAVARNISASHDLDGLSNLKTEKEKIDQLESEITVYKRNLLQTLSQPERDGQFEYTKAVLLGSFIVPKSIAKREFAPDSHVVRQAADLNSQFYDLLEKKEKLRKAGLSYKLDELKAKKPAELLDDRILAQYNILARKEWEDRLLEELITAKRVSNLEKLRQENRRGALENDMPEMEPEEVADNWLATHQEAESLIKKYAGSNGGIKEPHIIDQVNFNNLQARNNPQFENQFRSNFQNQQGSENPQAASNNGQNPPAEQLKPQADKPNPFNLLSQQPVNREVPVNPPKQVAPSQQQNMTQPSRENDLTIKPPSRQQSRELIRKPDTPLQKEPTDIHEATNTLKQANVVPVPISNPDKQENNQHLDGVSDNAQSEHMSEVNHQNPPASKQNPPLIMASKAEINDVLGDSFPVGDFQDEIHELEEDEIGMFMPDSVLRPVANSQLGNSQAPGVSGVMGSSNINQTPKPVEITQEDLKEFEDLDDFEF